MDIDNIIPLLFLAFWVFAALFGNKNKKKKSVVPSQKSRSSGGLMDRVQQTVEEMATKLEASTNDFDPYFVDEENEAIDNDVELPFTISSEEVEEEVKDKPVFSAVTEEMPAFRKKREFTKDHLREAIVWSEIMATPVGLRE